MSQHTSVPVSAGGVPQYAGGSDHSARLEKTQARILHTLHVAFAESLAELLRPAGDGLTVSLSSLEETTLEQHRARYGIPEWELAFAALAPQAGMLECEQGVDRLLVQHLLQCDAVLAPRIMTLSEIGVNVLEDFFGEALQRYADSWQRYAAFTLYLADYDVPISPNEPVFIAGYTVRSSAGTGKLFMLLRLAAWRTALPQPMPPRPQPVAETNLPMLTALGACDVPVRVIFGRTRISLQDMLTLQPGDIICLGSPPDAPLEIQVGNKPKLRGHVGTDAGCYLITIDDALPSGETSWT